ncbi:MAG: hypothetical protein HQ469_08030 [Cyanobacteria bacterium]|nr:hypothetical protein [Cyanobacteria bacterium bin.275]
MVDSRSVKDSLLPGTTGSFFPGWAGFSFFADLKGYGTGLLRRAGPGLVMPLEVESFVVRLSGCSGGFIESNVSRSFNFLRAVRALWEPPPPERREGFRFGPISIAELGAQAPDQAVAAG